MDPKDNPNIYGTRGWQAQKLHDQRQAKADAKYDFKPNPPAPTPVPQTHNNPGLNSNSPNSAAEGPRQRSRSSPKGAVTLVGLIVGVIAAAYASSHGVTSTLGLACAFGFSGGVVVAVLKKLTKS